MLIVGILGGSKVGKTAWRPEAKLTTIAVLGGVELDFRQATIPAGGVQVRSWSLFGGTKLIASRNMPVTLGGLSVFGGKEDKRGAPDAVMHSDGLRVTGVTLFGGLEVAD